MNQPTTQACRVNSRGIDPARLSRACIYALLAMLLLLFTGQSNSPTTQPAAAQPASSHTTAIPGVPLNANVAIIPVNGMITDATYDHLKYRIETSVSNGATMIVIEIDTPGGDMFAAIRISKLIRSSTVPTMAWVNRVAYSAGILIASSCNTMVMAPASSTGDCAPIQIQGGQLVPIPPTERAKLLSPLIEAFEANSIANGYDLAIFQAMCILDVRVYEVRHHDTGQIRFVNQDDYRVMVLGESYDVVTSEMTDENRPVGMSMTVARPEEQGRWSLVRLVHDGKTLLTISENQAQALGLSKATVSSVTNLQQILQANHISVRPVTWIQSTSFWLSQGWVRSILVVIMLLAAYFEMQSPGLGIGAMIAVAALVLLVVGPLLVGIAQWWQLLLVFFGIGLLLIEIFVVPGVGFVGATGLLAIFIGLTLMSVPTSSGAFNQPPSELAQSLRIASLWMLLAIILSGVGFAVMTYYFGQLPFMNRLTLSSSLAKMNVSPEEQAIHGPMHPVSGNEAVGRGLVEVGQTGIAMGPLRPSGRVRIGDQLVDVISDGQWIEQGQRIRVIEARGSRVVVQREV